MSILNLNSYQVFRLETLLEHAAAQAKDDDDVFEQILSLVKETEFAFRRKGNTDFVKMVLDDANRTTSAPDASLSE